MQPAPGPGAARPGPVVAGQQPAADPPPEDPALHAAGGRGMDELALDQSPCFRHPPVVHRQPVAGPQGKAQKVQPAGFVDLAATAAGLDLDQGFPNPPAERSRPVVAALPTAAASRLTSPSGLSRPRDRRRRESAVGTPARSLHRRTLRARRPTGGPKGRSASPSGRRIAAANSAARRSRRTTDRACRFRSAGRADRPRPFPLRLSCGPEHGANRRQRRHAFAVERDQVAGPIGQPRARKVERKLDRLGNQQIESPLAQVDVVPRFDAGRHESRGRGFGRSGGVGLRRRSVSTPM